MLALKSKFNFALYQKYFLITQHYIEDMYYKRIPLRQQHEEELDKLIKKGAQIIGGGQFPYNGAYYIINTNNKEIIDTFINNDPYTKKNLAKTFIEEIQPQIDNFDQLSNQFSYK